MIVLNLFAKKLYGQGIPFSSGNGLSIKALEME